MATTRISRRINASRADVYRALIDAGAVARWRVPDGMTSQVHQFEAREGGRFRVSLTYDAPDAAGKASGRTDTYHGHFVRMVPEEVVVEVFEFESPDPAVAGQMTMTNATIVTKDYPGDDRSDLGRTGRWRVNIRARRTERELLLGHSCGGIAGYDLAAGDVFMPHPVYNGWIAVVNPAARTTAPVIALLRAAHDRARTRATHVMRG